MNPKLYKRVSKRKCKKGLSCYYVPNFLSVTDKLTVDELVRVHNFDLAQETNELLVEVYSLTEEFRKEDDRNIITVFLSDLVIK